MAQRKIVSTIFLKLDRAKGKLVRPRQRWLAYVLYDLREAKLNELKERT
jgi:hypothetical protein